MKITNIGIDLAINVFKVHGVDEQSESARVYWTLFSPHHLVLRRCL